MFDIFREFQPGFNSSSMSWFGGGGFDQYKGLAQRGEDDIEKAMVTGDGIVQAGDQGGRATRLQFLYDVLETVAWEQKDATLMRRIPIVKCYSTAFEWSQLVQYGDEGNGFVAETGSDGLFGLTGTDDVIQRQVQNLKFLFSYKTVSLVTSTVKNLEDPETIVQKTATLELIGKANLAGYFGDSFTNQLEWNGLVRQITDWVTNRPQDQAILFDCQGAAVSEDLLEDMLVANAIKFGEVSLLLMSCQAYGDAQKLLFPKQRMGMGEVGTYGGDKSVFLSTFGNVKLEHDKMLRPNRPVSLVGAGATGSPRNLSQASKNSPVFSVTPFISATAISPGAGNWWITGNINTDIAENTTAPALPSGDGNNVNHNAAGVYYYAVGAVLNGLESTAWALGSGVAGDPDGGVSGVTLAASQVAYLRINPAVIGNTYSKGQVKYRVYRYGGPGVQGAPTKLSQYKFLAETGTPKNGYAAFYDNGMYIPNTDNAFAITENKGQGKGWFMAQLLPLMRRNGLPELGLAVPLAMLWFATPILPVPAHHIWLRNIGRLGTSL